MHKTMKKKSERVNPTLAIVVIVFVIVGVVAIFVHANRPTSNKKANDERRARILTPGGWPKGRPKPEFIQQRQDSPIAQANCEKWKDKTGKEIVDPTQE